MGDLTFSVPATATATTTPSTAAGPAGPRLRRRVHFRDLVASPDIWFTPPAADGDAMATSEAEPPPSGPEEDKKKGDKEEEEERMDLLWEDFNEELRAMRRAGGPHELQSESSDDGDDSNPAAAGCFPVLRPAARAGGPGHYRRRAGTWVLLMRIFRRLFVVEKTITAPTARRHAISSSAP
ncbi:hypothetical protein QOZ80_4AG0317030 [Eleusine coracana subsp. coracana]|nr:hypothetical protein QOZ80_4AG0317030 [Eleusine coracana subsp. coracana]